MEYDNTNKGVMFSPFANQVWQTERQKLIGRGNVNVDGVQADAMFVKETLGQGKGAIVNIYAKVGTLHKNDKNGNAKAPDFSGPMPLHPDKRVAGWMGTTKQGKPYMQLSISEKQTSAASPAAQQPNNQQQVARTPEPSSGAVAGVDEVDDMLAGMTADD